MKMSMDHGCALGPHASPDLSSMAPVWWSHRDAGPSFSHLTPEPPHFTENAQSAEQASCRQADTTARHIYKCRCGVHASMVAPHAV